jgi:hypothetical protein
MIDVIKLDVPVFIRLMELAREDIKNDMDVHDIAEIITKISQERLVTMADYDSIVGFMKHQGNDDELNDIKRLGGIT